MKVIWSARALERVVEIAEFIATDQPNAAANWVEGIFAAAEPLGRFPRMGRQVPESDRPELREVLHDGFRIIYRIHDESVRIYTVRHSRQSLLPDDPDLQ